MLLSCRRVGMKVSPCNEESCAKGIAEQVLRDVSAHHAPTPEPFEKTCDDRLF